MRAHVEAVGPCEIEAVSVGIFFKRSRSFAQLRPMQRWVALSFSLPRVVRHPLITRRVVPYGRHFHHVANLRTPDDLDDALRGYLTEAFLDAGVEVVGEAGEDAGVEVPGDTVGDAGQDVDAP